jgi:hypothetical protein
MHCKRTSFSQLSKTVVAFDKRVAGGAHLFHAVAFFAWRRSWMFCIEFLDHLEHFGQVVGSYPLMLSSNRSNIVLDLTCISKRNDAQQQSAKKNRRCRQISATECGFAAYHQTINVR